MEQKIIASLNEFTKQQLIDMLEKFIKKDKSIKSEVLFFIEQNIKQFKKINEKEINLSKFNELWLEAKEIIDRFDEYGGGPDDEEEVVCGNLYAITEFFKQSKLDNKTKKEFIKNCIKFYISGNSGFDDNLMDSIFEICKTKEEWLLVVSLLKKHHRSEHGYTHRLIMRIYKNELNDKKSYLKERLSDLKYGLDYYDLVKFYKSKGNVEKAIETAEQGIEKGEGRIIDLIKFMLNFYKNKKDYQNTLKFMILAFKEDPSLNWYKSIKEFCNDNEWPNIAETIYKILKEHLWIKVEIDYYNREYKLVWDFVKNAYGFGGDSYDFDKWAKKLEQHFPEEIISKYQEKIKSKINARNAKEYYVVKNHCQHIKRIFLIILKNEEAWNNYILKLRESHQNLPALQRELKEV